MKMRVMSDLHVEFGGVDLDDSVDCDVVVLAGDIDVLSRASAPRWARATFPRREIVQVLGNHELYGGEYHACIALARTAAADVGVHLLERESVTIKGVRFLGCTLWTDYCANGVDNEAKARDLADRCLADHRRIKISRSGAPGRFVPADAAAIHKDSVAWLDAELSQAHIGPTVVVTHHGPHLAVNHAHFIGSASSPAFVSDLSWLIEKHQPAVWISGHTHMSHRVSIGSTLLVSNQRGYYACPEVEEAPFNPGLVVTVGCQS